MSTVTDIEAKITRLKELEDETASSNSWWLHQMYKLRPDLYEKQAARHSEIFDLRQELSSIKTAVSQVVK